MNITLQEIRDEINYFTQQMSQLARTVSISALAVSWGILSGVTRASFASDPDLRKALFRISLLAVLAFLLDIAHYGSHFWAHVRNFEFIDQGGTLSYSRAYSLSGRPILRVAISIFFGKIIVALWAGVWLLLALKGFIGQTP